MIAGERSTEIGVGMPTVKTEDFYICSFGNVGVLPLGKVAQMFQCHSEVLCKSLSLSG